MDDRTPETRATPPLRIVPVRFHTAGSLLDHDAGTLELAVGDRVIVESERGLALGVVATVPRQASAAPERVRLPRVLRLADERDAAQEDENRGQERAAHRLAADLARYRRLPMKVVKVELSFDATRATVYFFAENRVDFRELVRDVASRLHLRVEMKQIGARDETKLVGALGPCGRELCCSSWLSEFHAVSVKMAKEQDLSLNPSKLAGMCGRLKCCLRYEYETYLSIKRSLPRAGSRVLSVKGDGIVVRQVPLRESVIVRRDDDGTEVEASLEDLVAKKPEPPPAPAP